MCEQPQEGPRDIWTQIYPMGHTGDRRRGIVPKWLLYAAYQLNIAALPEGHQGLPDRRPALSPSVDAAAPACLP